MGKNNKGKGHKGGYVKERELFVTDVDTVIAKITKALGCMQFEGKCFDGVTRHLSLRGSMVKRTWIGVGDYVLVSLFEGQEKHGIITTKYTQAEVKQLIAQKYIKEDVEEEEQNKDDESSDINLDDL